MCAPFNESIQTQVVRQNDVLFATAKWRHQRYGSSHGRVKTACPFRSKCRRDNAAALSVTNRIHSFPIPTFLSPPSTALPPPPLSRDFGRQIRLQEQ